MWKRYRFKTKSVEDYRPLHFNPSFPWWCTGYAGDMSYAIIVAYLPEKTNLLLFWDDAFDVEYTIEEKIEFSDRFPKPDYFVEMDKMLKSPIKSIFNFIFDEGEENPEYKVTTLMSISQPFVFEIKYKGKHYLIYLLRDNIVNGKNVTEFLYGEVDPTTVDKLLSHELTIHKAFDSSEQLYRVGRINSKVFDKKPVNSLDEVSDRFPSNDVKLNLFLEDDENEE